MRKTSPVLFFTARRKRASRRGRGRMAVVKSIAWSCFGAFCASASLAIRLHSDAAFGDAALSGLVLILALAYLAGLKHGTRT